MQSERSVNKTKKQFKKKKKGDCKGANIVPGMGDKRSSGAPLEKHLLLSEREVRTEMLSFLIHSLLSVDSTWEQTVSTTACIRL